MKRVLCLSLAALVVVLAVSCKKNPNGSDPEEQGPSVKTLAATEIQAFSARLHAQIDFADVDWGGVNFGFIWGTSDDAEGTYIQGEGVLDENNAYSAEITGLAPETGYWYKAFVEIDYNPYSGKILNFTTEKSPVPVPEAIDLGLPSGVKWASFNLGASKPEEYGDYFAWGETDPYYAKGHSQDRPCSDWLEIDGRTITGYDLETYKWYSSNGFTKYNNSEDWGTVDNNLDLDRGDDPEDTTIDDVARAKLGGKWRMPTALEWEELTFGCWPYWIDDYNGTHVKGIKFVSLAEGYEDRSIFIPYAGFRALANLNNAGDLGFYWSSSLYTENPQYAKEFYIARNESYINHAYRYYGMSIRPVYVE